jgi:E3 SUMO-protein ligase PIAS1
VANYNQLDQRSSLTISFVAAPVRPHFKASPFLEIKAWVGPAVLCPEAPSTQQRSSTTLKLQLNPSNLELLKRPTAIHQLRLFCTTKTSYDAATTPNHPAPVEFPLSCEAKVNNIPLTVNLKGKKSAAKVLAPHLNKDHAMYFGGQDNKVELVYTGTSQVRA